MKYASLLAAIAFSLVIAIAYGHEHASPTTTSQPKPTQLTEINREYVARIKPVFWRACSNCHSQRTVFPWYYNVPGIKQLLNSDVEEGREHMDITDDFPFKGHGTPFQDLGSIQYVITKKKMPPRLYRLMHSESSLTDDERLAILTWVEKSRARLSGTERQ